jgi:CRISPR-associated protein Csd2
VVEIPEIITDPSRRQEFALIFDITNGNPNGDPDASNAPRLDPETGRGLVTDVALKRKVRDYVMLTHPHLRIFIQSERALNTLKSEAADKVEPPLTQKERESKRPIPRLQSQMCADYYDIRMFGAVLATGEPGDRLNAGQVQGPVQLTFAKSIDRITPLHQTITRKAKTTEDRMESGETEMGEKWVVPYALYRAHGYVNPFFAERTGVTTEDLGVFWTAIVQLFDFDHSANRTEMFVRGLYVFTHDNKLGNAPAHKLFELITVQRAANRVTLGQSTDSDVPRQFTDYEVRVDTDAVPSGVALTTLVG